MTAHRAALRLLLAAVLLAPPLAGQPAASRADALFREGREASKRQDHALACQKFAESYALDPAPGTLVNLGHCEEKLGHLGLAWRHLTEALQQLPSTDDRIPVARSLLEGLTGRVGWLTVTLPSGHEGAGSKVLLDGSEVPERLRTNALAVDPGEHVVIGRSHDGREVRQVVQVSAGARHTVTLAFPMRETRAPFATMPPRPTPEDQPPERRPRVPDDQGSTMRTAGYAAGAVGLVGLGVGTFFGLSFWSTNNKAKRICAATPTTCPDTHIASHQRLVGDARSQGRLAIGAFVVGGAALGVGLVLLATAPSARTSAQLRLRLAPGPTAGPAGLELGGTW